MEDHRFIPLWLLPIIVLILILACNGCRGGRSLGNGSAGTVIVPQTPQQINESNRPNPQPQLPVPLKSAKSKPVPQVTPPAEAVPVKIEPKAAGEIKPFTPTIPEIAGPCLEAPRTSLISPPQKNAENIISCHEPRNSVSWFDLFLFYLACILALLTSWMIYDLAGRYFKKKKELDNQKKDVKVKKSIPKRKPRKRV